MALAAQHKRAARPPLDPEVHHRLVDRADLLDIERAVREPFAVEHQKAFEHTPDRAVGDERQAPNGILGADAAFEKREAVGVEEAPFARGEPERIAPAARMDQPEEREEARPGAIAAVHQIVAVPGGIVAQFLEQPAQPVILLVQRVGRHQVAILGIEHEDEPHQHRNEPGIEKLRVVRGEPNDPRLRRDRRAVGSPEVGGDEAAEQHMQGAEDLASEPGRNRVLRLPAGGEQRAEALVRLGSEHPIFAEQQRKRSEDRPPHHLRHIGDAEGQVTRCLAGRRIDEPHRLLCADEAGRYAGFAQQPLEADLRRRRPTVDRGIDRIVERGPRGLNADQQLRGTFPVYHLPGRFERYRQLGQANLLRRIGTDEILLLPAEQVDTQRFDVGDSRVVVVQERVETLLMGPDVAVDDDATLDQHRRGDDEPDRLDEAQPLVMRGYRGAGLRIGRHHPVASHR